MIPSHVIKRLNKMVDDVRSRYQNQFQNASDPKSVKMLKNCNRLLKTKEYNQAAYWGKRLNEYQRRLQKAFELAPDLWEAYETLQFFHDILAAFPYSVQQDELTE